MRRSFGGFLATLMLLGSAVAAPVVPTAAAAPLPVGNGLPVPAAPGQKDTRADSAVVAVMHGAVRGEAAGLEAAGSFGLRVSAGRVRVVVEASDTAAAGKSLAAARVDVERTAGDLIQVLVAPGQLDSIVGAAGVRYVRAPLPRYAEAVTDEAVATTNASAWQAAGRLGAGVKVGIIDLGFAGYASLQASGDLPATLTTQDYCGGQLNTYTDHGAAVASIVHKMAPSAQLYLICVDTDVDLAAGEQYAKSNGITVINHSVGWYNSSRGDGTGDVMSPDATAADARANGILWVNAAGNDATRHWSGTFVNGSGGDPNLGWNRFASGDIYDRFTIPTNATACVYLKWDDWPASSQDYDLAIYRIADNTDVAESTNPQTGTQPPVEGRCYTNTGATQTFGAAIYKYAATLTPRFDMFVLGPGTIQYQTLAGSIAEPASSPATLAVGAVCWAATTIEPFSSQGPTIDGRTKPDMAGPDRNSGPVYGAFSTCSPTTTSGFAGTSAAAPHVAGAAALVKASNPALTVAQLQAYLTATATDLGPAGADKAFGAGMLHLPTPASPPAAPTAVAGIGYNNSALVSWTAPANIGGSPITGYTVTANPGPGTCSTTGALACTVTGLTNGTPYTFTVRAANVAGTGPASAASGSVTPIAVPDAPTGVHGVGWNTIATITWTAPAANGSPITGYTVTASPGPRSCATTTALTCTVTGLTNGMSYSFTVTASSALGTGPRSAPSNTVIPAALPTAPRNVVAVAGNASAAVSWTVPASTGGAAITNYRVTATPGGRTCNAGGLLGCTVTGLANGTWYTFTVVATNPSGSGPASAASAPVVPEPPVARYSGADLFATAAAVSANTFPANCGCVAYVAYAYKFPDGLAAGAAAAKLPGPVLFVDTNMPVNASTAAELTRLKPTKIVVVGGPGSISDAVYAALAAYAPAIVRYGGTDRYEVAATISRNTWTASPCNCVAYVAAGYNFPDAVMGAALAGKVKGPMLLVATTGAVNTYTRTELLRLKPTKIVVLGGTGSVSSSVYTALSGYGAPIVRYYGPDRYAAAADASSHTFPASCGCVVYIAGATDFNGAIAGGSASASSSGTKLNGPLLYVGTSGVNSYTAKELSRLKPKRIVVLGNTSVVPAAVMTALAKYVVP